jgi:hypothetical protein
MARIAGYEGRNIEIGDCLLPCRQRPNHWANLSYEDSRFLLSPSLFDVLDTPQRTCIGYQGMQRTIERRHLRQPVASPRRHIVVDGLILKVLLQAHQLFSHDAVEQSTFQSDIYSAIYYLSFVYLSNRKQCDNSYCVRLYSLELWGCFGVGVAHSAVKLVPCRLGRAPNRRWCIRPVWTDIR